MIKFFKVTDKNEKNFVLGKINIFIKQGFYCKSKPRTLAKGDKYLTFQNVSGSRKINIQGKAKYVEEIYNKYKELKIKKKVVKRPISTYKGKRIDNIESLEKKS